MFSLGENKFQSTKNTGVGAFLIPHVCSNRSQKNFSTYFFYSTVLVSLARKTYKNEVNAINIASLGQVDDHFLFNVLLQRKTLTRSSLNKATGVLCVVMTQCRLDYEYLAH